MSNHFVRCLTAPTTTATYTIRVNGTSIATFTFNAGSTTATVTNILMGNVINAGDILTITAPSVADSTLSDIYYTFRGTTNG
jgi:hypothetical protein